MGNGASSASAVPKGSLGARSRLDDSAQAASNRGSLFAALQRSGRYAAVTLENGATVHILGVLPSSSRCEEEAHGLVMALSPSHLYVDLAPEWVAALQEEVAAGRVGEWTIPDTSPAFRIYPGAGVVGSLLIRNQLADNDFLGLMGAEWFGPYKVALAAIAKQARAGGSLVPAPPEPGSGADAASPRVLAFPYSMHYNNGNTLDRPSVLLPMLVGNNSFGSDAVHALLGSNAAIMSGERADVEHTAALPATGYITRQQVSDLQRSFRERVNAFVSSASSSTADAEADLARREVQAREDGRAGDAQAYSFAALKSQVQSQAVAHALRSAGSEAGPGQHVVALVNLGTLASLTRNWDEAQPPEVLIPPFSPLAEAMQYVAPTLLLGSLGYGVYRAFRRFPKTTGFLGLVGVGAGTVFGYNVVYSDGMRYGFGVRAALARPRVTSSVAGLRTA